MKKKPQAWGSDLSSDLSVKVDENKRASSPSPSEGLSYTASFLLQCQACMSVII